VQFRGRRLQQNVSMSGTPERIFFAAQRAAVRYVHNGSTQLPASMSFGVSTIAMAVCMEVESLCFAIE